MPLPDEGDEAKERIDMENFWRSELSLRDKSRVARGGISIVAQNMFTSLSERVEKISGSSIAHSKA